MRGDLNGKSRLWLAGWIGGGAIALGAAMGLANRIPQAVVSPSARAQQIFSSEREAERSFLQAAEALEHSRAALALSLLENLEVGLPNLADRVLMMRAIAYETAASPVSAERTWTELIDSHPRSPLVPRALLGLRRTDELRSRFPNHSVTVEYLQAAIEQQPHNVELIRHLAQIAPDSEGLSPHINRWVELSRASFGPDDWQLVADAYWAQREYGRASRAYQRTRVTSQNLYRLGRAHHISREPIAAAAAYGRLLAQFPNAAETGEARLRWAEVVNTATAISLLQQEAEFDRDTSPRALQRLARTYAQSRSPVSAAAARQELWQRFPQHSAAAAVAWEVALQRAAAGNFSGAATLAQQIASEQPSTDWGAQLRFWAGKWMARAGNHAGAAEAYRLVLQDARSSYYAWRAAALLGLPTGDFRVGRTAVSPNYNPALLPLPQASAAVQQLHQMGAADAAWQQWSWEAAGRQNETAAALFTGGVLRNRGSSYFDRLSGINQVASLLTLAKQGDPVARQLQQRPDFWQTVYPLHHYETLVAETAAFNLNPLVMAGLIRQESRFEPEIVSRSGALGLTQVLPSTGAWIAGQIGRPRFDLRNPEDNLHFGAWYLDYTHRTYQNNSMLAIASYNAGPGNVAKWMRERSLADPDLFVEQIPFNETRHYVKAVLGNYWNYLQIYAPDTNNLSALVQSAVRSPQS
ncbi:lytic transglycosylase domain-containing protein [Synechococcus sp. PCC 7336]|uniref:lytic transglycosylase domain-containing protein n=1 Tax=Synechococcus sp. PCC 7336 TaxID=195250 RepID=UPI000344BAC6|nr:lytic transglycosylase domain-containing protein [Synechococcus sp. PCC 7336]